MDKKRKWIKEKKTLEQEGMWDQAIFFHWKTKSTYIYVELGIQVSQTLPDKYVSVEEEKLLHYAPENKVKVP